MFKRGLAVLTALLIGSSLLCAPIAMSDPPSQDDIDRSKQKEKEISGNISSVEAEITQLNAQLEAAKAKAETLRLQYQEAQDKMADAIDEAVRSQEYANEAKRRLQDSKEKIGSMGQALYRSGGVNVNALSAFMNADSITSLTRIRMTHQLLGKHQNAAVSSFAALDQVAKILQKQADAAADAATTAAGEAERLAQEAQAQEKTAQDLVASTADKRNSLMQKLAEQKGTTVALVKARQAYLEEQRRKAEAERRRQEEARRKAEEARRRAEADEAERRRERTIGDNKVTRPPANTEIGSGWGADVVRFARRYAGVPYVWGGSSPTYGWDCTGYTYFVYNHMGMNLPRFGQNWYIFGNKLGYEVPYSEARPGDYMDWPHHVGIYTGNGMHIAANNERLGTKEIPVWGSPTYIRITNRG